MATSRFRLVTLVVCVVAALTVYFWPTTTPGIPSAMPPGTAASTPDAPSPSATSATASSPRISAIVATPSVTPSASSGSPEPDLRPPPPVSHLTLAGNSTTTFTVAWLPATDAATYEILVNGLAVGTTAGTEATLLWPGDDEDILIQVSALDASGNRSEWRSIVILAPAVVFPTPTPTPTPSPSITPTPTPTPAPTSPSVTPTKTKSKAVPTPGRPTTGTAAPDPGPSSSTPGL